MLRLRAGIRAESALRPEAEFLQQALPERIGIPGAQENARGTPVTVPAQIIVTKLPSGVFPELMPEEGRQYPAKLHPARGHMAAVMTIEIGGKEIILRPNEYKEVP